MTYSEKRAVHPPEPIRPDSERGQAVRGLADPAPASDVRPELKIIQADVHEVDTVRRLNVEVFDERRIINTLDRPDLLMLLAVVEGEPVGFKVGYRENRFTFYSAKGGVLPEHRRRGIARRLLHAMMDYARTGGYVRFAFDTFPNKHAGMTVLGLAEGFRVVKADYNAMYRDFRLRFEKKL